MIGHQILLGPLKENFVIHAHFKKRKPKQKLLKAKNITFHFFEITYLNIEDFLEACNKLKKDKTGAIFVFERNNNLDFVKEDGDSINAELSIPIIESIFYKNSPLHDGAVIIVGNVIVASRVTLPVSKSKKINKSLGLRHKAGIGITEESDAISIVISEETGKLSYIKSGKIISFKNNEELKSLISNDLL